MTATALKLEEPEEKPKAKYHIVENPPKDTKGFNVVTNEEIVTFEKVIRNKAARFIQQYTGRNPNRYVTDQKEYSVKVMGWTYDDICQELRIAAWVALKNYDPTKAYTAYGLCKKENFVFKCIDNRTNMLHTHVWSKKRGFEAVHDYESILLEGEYHGEDD